MDVSNVCSIITKPLILVILLAKHYNYCNNLQYISNIVVKQYRKI